MITMLITQIDYDLQQISHEYQYIQISLKSRTICKCHIYPCIFLRKRDISVYSRRSKICLTWQIGSIVFHEIPFRPLSNITRISMSDTVSESFPDISKVLKNLHDSVWCLSSKPRPYFLLLSEPVIPLYSLIMDTRDSFIDISDEYATIDKYISIDIVMDIDKNWSISRLKDQYFMTLLNIFISLILNIREN